ncbi:MAG TPA: hypothetical protein PLK40_02460 [Bacteroidaceae bacterium]|nr:hypothetical protein [Bacteroidaceae bacterium]
MEILYTAGWEDFSVWIIPLVIGINLIYKTVSNYKKQETADLNRDNTSTSSSEQPPSFFEQLEKKLQESQRAFTTKSEEESTLDNIEQSLYSPRPEKEHPFMFKGENAYPIKEGYTPIEIEINQPISTTKTSKINKRYKLNSTSRLKQAVIWSEILRSKYQDIR